MGSRALRPAMMRRLARETKVGLIILLDLPEELTDALRDMARAHGFQPVMSRRNSIQGQDDGGSCCVLVRGAVSRYRSFDLAVPPEPERPGFDLLLDAGGRRLRLVFADLGWRALLRGTGRRRLRGVMDRRAGVATLVVGTVPTALYIRFMTSLVSSHRNGIHDRRLYTLQDSRIRYALVTLSGIRLQPRPIGNLHTVCALSGGRLARFRLTESR